MKTPVERVLTLILLGLLCAGCQTAPPNSLATHRSALWERDIAAFEASAQTNPPPKNCIVFVGSSSFTFWSTLESDMAPLPVLNRGVLERPRKLQQQRAQAAFFKQWRHAFLESFFVFAVGLALVREALPELGGKLESRIVCDPADPRLGHLGGGGMIETGVDFDGVEELGEERRFVEIARPGTRIDDTIPIFVRPSSGPDANFRRLPVHIRLLFAYQFMPIGKGCQVPR